MRLSLLALAAALGGATLACGGCPPSEGQAAAPPPPPALPDGSPIEDCVEGPPGLRCIPGGTVSAGAGEEFGRDAQDRLAEDGGGAPFAVAGIQSFLLDERPAGAAEYLACVRDCACEALPEGADGEGDLGLDVDRAADYCAHRGLRTATPEECLRAAAYEAGACVPPDPSGAWVAGLWCAADLTSAGELWRIAAGLPRTLTEKPAREARDDPPSPESFAARDPSYEEHRSLGPVPTETGFAVDASYKDVWMVEDLLWAYHLQHPDITRIYELGRSRQGRPILAIRVTDNPDRDEDELAVLLNGGAHGHELLSVDYAFDALRQLLEQRTEPRVRRWIEELDLWVVPMVSPDGNWTLLRTLNARKVGRRNGMDSDRDCVFEPRVDGVDLNRNYPFGWGILGEEGSSSDPASPYYRGEEPASEPETRALVALARQHRFAAAISWHTHGSMVISPYTIEGVRNPDPDVAWDIAGAMVESSPQDFRLRRSMYPVDGTDQDWHFHAHGTLAYIVEGSHHNPLDPGVRRASIEGVRPLLGVLLDRVLDGPGITGHVLGPDGEPVEAVVEIDPTTTFEGERWTSRPRDGRFYRALAGPGTYTVRAVSDEAGVVERGIEIGEGVARVELTLAADGDVIEPSP